MVKRVSGCLSDRVSGAKRESGCLSVRVSVGKPTCVCSHLRRRDAARSPVRHPVPRRVGQRSGWQRSGPRRDAQPAARQLPEPHRLGKPRAAKQSRLQRVGKAEPVWTNCLSDGLADRTLTKASAKPVSVFHLVGQRRALFFKMQGCNGFGSGVMDGCRWWQWRSRCRPIRSCISESWRRAFSQPPG